MRDPFIDIQPDVLPGQRVDKEWKTQEKMNKEDLIEHLFNAGIQKIEDQLPGYDEDERDLRDVLESDKLTRKNQLNSEKKIEESFSQRVERKLKALRDED